MPDTFIEYMRSLVLKPLDAYTCSISYSSKDEAFATLLSADLHHEKVRCWLAPEQMKSGNKVRHGIDEPIRFSDKLLLVLSEHSIASPWVQMRWKPPLRKKNSAAVRCFFPLPWMTR